MLKYRGISYFLATSGTCYLTGPWLLLSADMDETPLWEIQSDVSLSWASAGNLNMLASLAKHKNTLLAK